MSESVQSITIEQEIPLFGREGDTLETRLRKVGLRGFPDVQIYSHSGIHVRDLTSDAIMDELHTPQPRVYRTHLDRIGQLDELFRAQGVDILHLESAYDFVAVDNEGVETNWTMLPPIVERFSIPVDDSGALDYEQLMDFPLLDYLVEHDLRLNPEVKRLTPHPSGDYSLINDGSHRIHYGFEQGGIRVLEMSGMTPGFPYYAAPQSYGSVRVVPERDDNPIDTKIHIVDSPGHKQLYRLFPSGGITSGDIRHDPRLDGKK